MTFLCNRIELEEISCYWTFDNKHGELFDKNIIVAIWILLLHVLSCLLYYYYFKCCFIVFYFFLSFLSMLIYLYVYYIRYILVWLSNIDCSGIHTSIGYLESLFYNYVWRDLPIILNVILILNSSMNMWFSKISVLLQTRQNKYF